jgi:hypothetical protein
MQITRSARHSPSLSRLWTQKRLPTYTPFLTSYLRKIKDKVSEKTTASGD